MARFAVAFGLLLIGSGRVAQAAESTPLVLEAKIPLGNVQGRIDHLAIDLERQRLYVAELGNDSVGVVDLKERRVLRTVSTFLAPQGIGYEPLTDAVYIANGGDGSVRLLQGRNLEPLGRIDLGEDADNVRVDATHRRVVVGYGHGALAVIDSESRKKIADITLKADPESFRLADDGRRVFVNLPDAHEIAVVDLLRQKQIASWSTQELNSNFPMILGDAERELWVVFRRPPKLVAINTATGARIATLDSCADADDIFFDAKRRRLYVSCGAGYVDVWEKRGADYTKIAQLTTPAGARTALFVPELDRLYLAVRATPNERAAIWVYHAF